MVVPLVRAVMGALPDTWSTPEELAFSSGVVHAVETFRRLHPAVLQFVRLQPETGDGILCSAEEEKAELAAATTALATARTVFHEAQNRVAIAASAVRTPRIAVVSKRTAHDVLEAVKAVKAEQAEPAGVGAGDGGKKMVPKKKSKLVLNFGASSAAPLPMADEAAAAVVLAACNPELMDTVPLPVVVQGIRNIVNRDVPKAQRNPTQLDKLLNAKPLWPRSLGSLASSRTAGGRCCRGGRTPS